jgi:hypothetical protein
MIASRFDIPRSPAARAVQAVVVGIALAVLGASIHASEPVPLPKFALKTLDGVSVQSASALPAEGKWLLVYVQANCRPCDRLLSLVKTNEHPEIPPKMIIVVSRVGSEAAAGMRAKYANLADATWYIDDPGDAWTALKMTGVPMVFAVQGKTVRWSLSGVLPSEDRVKSILASWVVVE